MNMSKNSKVTMFIIAVGIVGQVIKTHNIKEPTALTQVGLKTSLESAVIPIYRKITRSRGMLGTAFYVKAPSGQVYAVTNEHVCGRSSTLFVIVGDVEQVLEVVKLEPAWDLCILKGQIYAKVLPISPRSPTYEVVYTAGFSGAKPISFHKGWNLGHQTIKIDNQVYFVHKTNMEGIFKGASGSPVVNQYGEVIGVINASTNAGTATTFISNAYLNKALEGL